MATRQIYDPGRGSANVSNKIAASSTEQANIDNAAREAEVRALYDEIINIYGPGGTYAQSQQAMIDRQKQTDLASATQGLISSGLYGSTMTAALPSKWEESVGSNARLKLEDMRTEAYTNALGQKANFINSIETQTPSYETLANLSMQAGAQPSQSLDSWLSDNFVRPGGGGSSYNAPVQTMQTTSEEERYQTARAERAKAEQEYVDLMTSLAQGQKLYGEGIVGTPSPSQKKQSEYSPNYSQLADDILNPKLPYLK